MRLECGLARPGPAPPGAVDLGAGRFRIIRRSRVRRVAAGC